MKKILSSLTIQILIALLLGTVVGHFFGQNASGLGEIGKIVIQLIKAVAAPLLFVVILHSFITTDIEFKSGIKLAGICTLNGIMALVIGISFSKIFKAGEHFHFMKPSEGELKPINTFGQKEINFLESLKSYFPESLIRPLLDNTIISLVLIAIFFGLALRVVKKHYYHEAPLVDELAKWLSLLQRMFEVALTWLVHLIPFAVFGVVAKTIGEYGFAPLKGLMFYILLGLAGLAVHIIFVYHSWLFIKGVSIKEFWRIVRPTVIYAIGVNSSLATLPLTLKNLQELKVSKKAATLGACVGTNFNNDGILLYEAMAVFFVAQAMGIDLSFTQHLVIAMTCVMGTIGVAGIPEAGFITLALVLATVGLPTDILPILLTVDWILGRARSVTNVLGDMTVSIAIDETRKGA